MIALQGWKGTIFEQTWWQQRRRTFVWHRDTATSRACVGTYVCTCARAKKDLSPVRLSHFFSRSNNSHPHLWSPFSSLLNNASSFYCFIFIPNEYETIDIWWIKRLFCHLFPFFCSGPPWIIEYCLDLPPTWEKDVIQWLLLIFTHHHDTNGVGAVCTGGQWCHVVASLSSDTCASTMAVGRRRIALTFTIDSTWSCLFLLLDMLVAMQHFFNFTTGAIVALFDTYWSISGRATCRYQNGRRFGSFATTWLKQRQYYTDAIIAHARGTTRLVL